MNKTSNKGGKLFAWASVSIAVIASIGIFGGTSSNSQPTNAPALVSESVIPECASKAAIEFLKETLEQNPSNKLLDYSNIQEFSFNHAENSRTCLADIVLTSGNTTVKYSFSSAKSDPSKTILQIEELTTADDIARQRQIAADYNRTPEQKALDDEIANRRKEAQKALLACYKQHTSMKVAQIKDCQSKLHPDDIDIIEVSEATCYDHSSSPDYTACSKGLQQQEEWRKQLREEASQ